MWWNRASQPVTPRPQRLDFEGEHAKWKNIKDSIEYLVIVKNDYVVFIDKDIDVDWSYRSNGESHVSGTPEFNSVLNTVASLEATPCDELPSNIKLQFKRLLGEGLARAFDADFEDAKHILDSAKTYIDARSQETSRYWYLSASAVMCAVFMVAGAIIWLTRTWIEPKIGHIAFWELLSACAGAIGALLSVIGRTGKQHFDCSAGKRLHYAEAVSRIWAGAISGLVVGFAVSAGLFFTALTQNGHLPEVMILSAIASGVSERLANSIIADLHPKEVR